MLRLIIISFAFKRKCFLYEICNISVCVCVFEKDPHKQLSTFKQRLLTWSEICMWIYSVRLCVCVRACVVLPGLPGSRGAGWAGRWIVLLDCGVAVSRLLLRMDVGDRGQAYHCVTSQTTGCHAPQSMTRPPLRSLFFFNFPCPRLWLIWIDPHWGVHTGWRKIDIVINIED